MQRTVLRQHQSEASDAAIEALKRFDRTQVIMACGSGKTFIGFEVSRRLIASLTIILVPTINLGQQILAESTRFVHFRTRLAVSSPRERIVDVADVTTNPKFIAEYMTSETDALIVSTYAPPGGG